MDPQWLQWFGVSWDADINSHCRHIAVPVGKECTFCAEAIELGDSGIVYLDPELPLSASIYHVECYTRTLAGAGGVFHVLRMCTCYGGTLPSDPPKMSRRDSARHVFRLLRQSDKYKLN